MSGAGALGAGLDAPGRAAPAIAAAPAARRGALPAGPAAGGRLSPSLRHGGRAQACHRGARSWAAGKDGSLTCVKLSLILRQVRDEAVLLEQRPNKLNRRNTEGSLKGGS